MDITVAYNNSAVCNMGFAPDGITIREHTQPPPTWVVHGVRTSSRRRQCDSLRGDSQSIQIVYLVALIRERNASQTGLLMFLQL